jgi:hypothetical protein
MHYRFALRGGHDFGEEKLDFLVTEFAQKSEAGLTVQIGGRKQQFTQSIYPQKMWALFIVPHIHVDVAFGGLYCLRPGNGRRSALV